METVPARSESFVGKRSRNSDSASSDYIEHKKQRWYYTLESDHADPATFTDSDACETIYSYQDKSTDIVQDTPDTSTSSSLSDSGDMRVVEYEVASLSEDGRDTFQASILGLDDDSLTAPEDFFPPKGYNSGFTMEDAIVSIVAEDAGSSAVADGSGTEGTMTCSESTLMPLGEPLCGHCRRPKAYAAFRFCSDCFRAKRDFYPPRPRRKRKRFESSNTGSQTSCTSATTETTEMMISSQTTESTIFGDDDTTINRCKVCLTLPRDAGFLHNRMVVHAYACYGCSQRIWKSCTRCPVCNYKAYGVVKIFFH